MPPATAPTVAPTAAPAGPPTIAPPTAPVAAPAAAPCANALVEPARAIRNVATIIFCISTLRLIDGRKRGGFPNVPDYVALYLLSAEQRLSELRRQVGENLSHTCFEQSSAGSAFVDGDLTSSAATAVVRSKAAPEGLVRDLNSSEAQGYCACLQKNLPRVTRQGNAETSTDRQVETLAARRDAAVLAA